VSQKWGGSLPGWEAPATRADAITPADSDFSDGVVYRALYVGTGGSLVVRLADDAGNVTLTNIADGTLLTLCVKRVGASTTASGIIGLR
jgi:hypothetical protein